SPGSESIAASNARTSHATRPSLRRFARGIRPSATILSKVPAATLMYAAAASRQISRGGKVGGNAACRAILCATSLSDSQFLLAHRLEDSSATDICNPGRFGNGIGESIHVILVCLDPIIFPCCVCKENTRGPSNTPVLVVLGVAAPRAVIRQHDQSAQPVALSKGPWLCRRDAISRSTRVPFGR